MAIAKAINKINKDFEGFEICRPAAANSLFVSGSVADLSFRGPSSVFSSG